MQADLYPPQEVNDPLSCQGTPSGTIAQRASPQNMLNSDPAPKPHSLGGGGGGGGRDLDLNLVWLHD